MIFAGIASEFARGFEVASGLAGFAIGLIVSVLLLSIVVIAIGDVCGRVGRRFAEPDPEPEKDEAA